MKKKKVLVLFGGKSYEHEISIASARSIIAQLDKNKYQVLPMAIDKDGRWLSLQDSNRLLLNSKKTAAKTTQISLNKSLNAESLSAERIDVVFPVLHGSYGEDGTLQGMLEMLNVPYVGAGVLGSALGMDKVMQKKIFAFERLPIVNWLAFDQYDWKKKNKILTEIAKKFFYPIFIKPIDLGSSIGITKAHNEDELKKGIKTALSYSDDVLIEQGIDAREIECAILGNKNPQASLPGEIMSSGEFYDYKSKYINGTSKLIIPAKISSELVKRIQDLAIRGFLAIKCLGMARVDFLFDKNTNQLYLNEINTIPGFTEISMYAKLWEATGVGYSDLLDRLIELALERHAGEVKKNKKQNI